MINSGLYTFTNTINNKIYLGCSRNIYLRRNQHLYSLRNNIHENEYLQKAWNKYGEKNFVWEELIFCEEEYLLSFENYWVNLLQLFNRKYGYNLKTTRPTGRGGNSVETRLKISKSNKGRKCPWEGKTFTLQHRNNISKGLTGRTLSSSHLLKVTIINRAKDYLGENNPFYGKKHAKEYIENKIKQQSIPIVQYDLQDNPVKEWESATLAARELNLSQGNIQKCVVGIYNTAYNFKWKYK